MKKSILELYCDALLEDIKIVDLMIRYIIVSNILEQPDSPKWHI